MSKTEETQELASAKASMDVKTARKYLQTGKLPSESRPERTWRARKDPFEAVWKDIQEQVEGNPGLEAKTIFEALQRRFGPGRFDGIWAVFGEGNSTPPRRLLFVCASPGEGTGSDTAVRGFPMNAMTKGCQLQRNRAKLAEARTGRLRRTMPIASEDDREPAPR